MKNKSIGIILGCALAVCAPAYVSAEETTEAVTAAAEETQDAVITITVEDAEIVIADNTGESEAEITVGLEETAEEEEASEEETSEEAAGDSADKTYVLTLTSGTASHIFEAVSPQNWQDAELTEDHGFWYISYTDADGKTQEIAETAEENAVDEELAMWTITAVNLRESADLEAEVVTVVPVGSECTVTGILPGWYHAEYNGQEGYLSHKYLTEDEAAAEEAAAEAAAKAAASAQSSQTQNYNYSSSGSSSGSSSSGSSSSASQSSGGSSAQECLTNGLLN